MRPTIGMNYSSLTVDNTAGGVALSASAYRPSGEVQAETAFITVEGGPIRYIYSPGTTVTSTVGHKAVNGTILVLKGQNQMESFRAIRTGSTDGTLHITMERE
jgi:hypothetical protein